MKLIALVGILMCLGVGLVQAAPAPDPVEAVPLLAQARDQRRPRYDFAVAHGARFVATPDGRSHYLVWAPPGVKSPAWIVTLHGHGSYAVEELPLWYDELAKRGIGIIAIQWWFGGGETTDRYYSPQELYRNIDRILHQVGAGPRTVLAHGFSRGAANIYGVTVLDGISGNHFFALTVANAGKASLDFPVNAEIERGVFGQQPFEGTHWVTFAAARDSHPDRDGVPGMRETAAWIRRLGGRIELAIEDAQADHGGFHRNPANMRAALDVFDRVRARGR